MLIRISDFNSSDTVLDLPAHLLQGNVISDGKNYKLEDGRIAARAGYTESYGAPTVAPYAIIAGLFGAVPYWLYAGLTKIYLLNSSTHTNVTRQSVGVDVNYTATDTTPWTGGGFNGLSVLNNQNDVPQSFSSVSGKCSDMANWPADLRCKSLRPFKNFLVAAGVTEASTEYPQVLRWSHPADPGSVPGSWDYTDPTKDAGRTAMAETKGVLVDSLAAQDVHIVYKDDSTYYMQFIGAPYIFDFQPISLTSGLLGQNCAANFPGGQIALTNEDVVMVTPRGIQSIATKRIRRNLFSSINFNTKRFAFVVANPAMSEVWVCIPASSTYSSRAYIWNWNDNKWSIRELPNLTAMATGYEVSATDTWATSTDTWADGADIWGSYELSGGQFIGASPNGTGALYVFGEGHNDGAVPTAVEVVHHSLDVFNQQIPPERMKLVQRIRPHFTPDSLGAVVTFEFGVRNGLDETISWSSPQTFTVGASRDLFVRKQGRYFSWRIRSSVAAGWALDGMDLEVAVGGIY